MLFDCIHLYIVHCSVVIMYSYYTHLTAFFSRTTWVSWCQKGRTLLDLMKHKMMGWQWHQLDRVQIICILLWTDNLTSTSSLNFLLTGCSSCQPTVSKH